MFYLSLKELGLDMGNMCMVFILETVVFLNMIIVLLFSIELNTLFDMYCSKHLEEVFGMTMYSENRSKLQELEDDGFKDIEIFYDEGKGKYCAYAKIQSLKKIDYKMFSWRRKGIVIRSDMQEVLNVMIFVKMIFICITLLGILLCLLAVGNFYQMKIQRRIKFINMLYKIGLTKRKICWIYELPFCIIGTVSIVSAYILSFPVMDYFNDLIRHSFSGIELGTQVRNDLAIIIYIIFTFLVVIFLNKKWKHEVSL